MSHVVRRKAVQRYGSLAQLESYNHCGSLAEDRKTSYDSVPIGGIDAQRNGQRGTDTGGRNLSCVSLAASRSGPDACAAGRGAKRRFQAQRPHRPQQPPALTVWSTPVYATTQGLQLRGWLRSVHHGQPVSRRRHRPLAHRQQKRRCLPPHVSPSPETAPTPVLRPTDQADGYDWRDGTERKGNGRRGGRGGGEGMAGKFGWAAKRQADTASGPCRTPGQFVTAGLLRRGTGGAR
jgi:hypothetical protein